MAALSSSVISLFSSSSSLGSYLVFFLRHSKKISRRATARNRRTAPTRPSTAPTITPVLSLLDSEESSVVGGGVGCVGELVVVMIGDGNCRMLVEVVACEREPTMIGDMAQVVCLEMVI